MPFIPIVRSKLHRPRIVGDFVVRSGLLHRVEAGSVLPLTLLAAPVGYGKTSLVAHWLENRDGLAAWLSLDAEDSDLLVFVSYFAAAVRTVVPDACGDTLACLAAGQPASLAALAGHLSNDLESLPARLVLVLDDYHRIASTPTHALLDRLLAHPVDNLHLVVITCRDPPLSLGMLRAREALTEIRMQDLQFAASDTALLFKRCAGRAVSGPLLECLQQRSEGWPVGVRLAALALRDGGEVAELERSFTGSTPQVQQFFIEEVLSQQAAGVRDWLLRTSISDRFCAALGDALSEGCTGGEGGERLDGRSFIQRVASGAMLCLAVDDQLEWYRYHRLFRAFLESQLRKQHTDAEVVELHRRATAWFEANGLLEEAIPHALAAADAAAAGQLLARHRNSLLNREDRHRLQRCLSLLPADTIEMDPELLLLKAWLMHHQGRQIETPVVLDRIEALLEGGAGGLDQAIVASLRGSVLALRGLQRYREGRADLALACAEQALHRLADDSPHARVTAQAVVAGARQMVGDLKGARQWIHDVLTRASGSIEVCQAPLVATLCFLDWMAADLAALQWTASQNDKLNDVPFASQGNWALGRYFLGLVQYQRNDLALAEATLLPALAVQNAPRLGYRTEISFMLAAVYQALGQADRAREIVDAVCAHLLRTGNSPALFRAQAYQAELALRQGRVDEAREWARNFDPGPVQLVYRFFNVPHLTLARVWIAEGSAENLEQAGRLLQLLQADLAARHNIRFLIEVLALQALWQRALGDEVAAGDLLAHAVALAQPGGFIRLFVDLGQDLVPTLKRLNPGLGSARYVGQILSALNDDWLVSAGRQQVGADLTRRELKILKLLAVRLSNVEISEELCISRATVKRHTQNIYRKLRASSRREAVLRARTLNILADG
jgi:LuxR family maltose regulon positive regulatory protein